MSLVRHGWLVGLLTGVAALLAMACGTASPDEKPLTTESPTSTAAVTAESSAVTQAPTQAEIKAVASPQPTASATRMSTAAPTPTRTGTRAAASPTPTAAAKTTRTATPVPTEEKVAESTPEPTPESAYSDLKIVTLLPRDAIPAILDPSFISAGEAWEQYLPEEAVLGVSVNGEHKAYSVPFLSSREIVNDELGGVAIAATW